MGRGLGRRWSTASAFVLATLAGCSGEHGPVASAPPPVFPDLLPAHRPEPGDRAGLPAVVRANNAFALAIYHRLRTRPGNLLISPACLSTGLALVRAGARGETERQVARVLQIPDDLDRPDEPFAALVRDLNADGEHRSYQVRLANALWTQDGYPLPESYRARLRTTFGLGDTRVDFAGRRAEACLVINDWTSERTGGRIPDVLRPEELPPRTRMVLTTALYLRASWRARFYREVTQPAAFHLESGRTIDVPTMHEDSYSSIHGYHDGGSFQALGLPCGSGGEFEMVVLLPRKTDGLGELEAALTPEALASWRAAFRRPEEIVIALPKYRLRAELSLNRLLSEAGMPLAFHPRADFSGINGKSADLFLAVAAQATFLDVNEEGIEAAAAMSVISPDAFGEEPPVFRADHPFVFLIRDTRSGCILFIGRVANPLDPTCVPST